MLGKILLGPPRPPRRGRRRRPVPGFRRELVCDRHRSRRRWRHEGLVRTGMSPADRVRPILAAFDAKDVPAFAGTALCGTEGPAMTRRPGDSPPARRALLGLYGAERDCGTELRAGPGVDPGKDRHAGRDEDLVLQRGAVDVGTRATNAASPRRAGRWPRRGRVLSPSRSLRSHEPARRVGTVIADLADQRLEAMRSAGRESGRGRGGERSACGSSRRAEPGRGGSGRRSRGRPRGG
jgi:hypothetical protein